MKEQKRRRLEHWHIIAGLLVLYDILVVNLSYFAALWIRFDCAFNDIPLLYLESYLRFTWVYTLLAIPVFWFLHYKKVFCAPSSS